MTTALRSFPEWQRKQVAERRANPSNGQGIGHVVAKEYLERIGVQVEKVEVVEIEEDGNSLVQE